jgi:predicted dehydrogenase
MHLRAAVEARKHVFAEKPLAVDAPGVRSVIESARIAKTNGTTLMSGFCYHYHQPKREAMKRIHDGAIGDITAMQVNYNTGPIWLREFDPKSSAMEKQMRNWYYYTWLSGDFIVEQHCHNLDKAAWAMKGEMPVAAVSLGGRQQRTDPKYGHIYDHFATVFEYANGVKLFSACRQMSNTANDVSDHFFGTKGSAHFSDSKSTHEILGPSKWEFTGDAPSMYQVEHNDLFAALRAGRPINDGEAAAHSTLMAILGRTAAYTGKRITWKQMLESKENMAPTKYEWGDVPTPTVAIPGVTKFV